MRVHAHGMASDDAQHKRPYILQGCGIGCVYRFILDLVYPVPVFLIVSQCAHLLHAELYCSSISLFPLVPFLVVLLFVFACLAHFGI